MKKFRHILLWLQTALFLGLVASCHDDLSSPDYPDADEFKIETGITIRIPNLTRAADFTRAEDPENAANVAYNEGKINGSDMWLFIYYAGTESGKTGINYNKAIKLTGLNNATLPSLKEGSNNTIEKDWLGFVKTETNSDIVLKVPMYPGVYKAYVVANLKEYLENGKSFTKGPATNGIYEPVDEDVLNKYIIDFSQHTLTTGGVLEPGHLPMVCFPEDVDEANKNNPTGSFNILDENVTSLSCNLNFLCSKVRYTVLFDNTATGQNNFSFAEFGATHFLDFNGATVTNVVEKTTVEADYASDSSDLKFIQGGDGNKVFNAPLNACAWPADGVWPGAGTTPDGTSSSHTSLTRPTNLSTAAADLWSASSHQRAWQGTIYLPSNPSSTRTSLTLNGLVDAQGTSGSLTGGSDNPYTVDLISGSTTAADGSTVTTSSALARGKFYDLTLRAKSRNSVDIETQVTISDWDPVYMGDFGHTWLIVDKTTGKVKSGESDDVTYSSNSSIIRMGCDTQTEDGRPIVVQSAHYAADKRIEFTVNPAIGINEFDDSDPTKPNTEGMASVWIEAGNHVRKYIDVKYSVKPYFEVTPEDAEIFWLENTPSDDSYTRVFTFKTNLGGIKGILDVTGGINGGTNKSGGSTIKFACSDENASTGTFTVTATKNPGTTVTHYFTVGPKLDGYSDLNQELKVDVKPPFGDYRIHFAVINDGQDGAFNQERAEKDDLWWYNGWGNTSWIDNDLGAVMYAYTQLGESGAAPPPERVWLFSAGFPGTLTTIDTNNDGWYYWTLDPNVKVKNPGGNGYAVEEKSVKPGETLLMFAGAKENYDSNGGFYRHRCPFHMDPGIQLFDFEDREGWIIFDPLSDPYYMIYDDKPIIDIVEYKVYIRNDIADSWQCFHIDYGHSSNTGTYSIWYDKNENVNGWRLLTFKAKAPHGDYTKAVSVQYNKNNNKYDLPLFGGANFYDENNPKKAYGYYDGSWHQGKPSGVN